MLSPIGSYEFHAPARIVFGWGRRREVGELAAALGRRAYLVWGSRTLKAGPLAAEILDSLRAAEVEPVDLATISHEPLAGDVDATAWALRELGAGPGTFVIAIGGGAALDLGKAVAAMATNRASPQVVDYLEGVGRGAKLSTDPLPVLAMPTTAGTGSEATRNAVISSLDPPFKKSLRSPRMLPHTVLVDPELTVSCPRTVTAHSGMDAITQCIESYLSRRARPIPSALALQGLRLAIPALPEACRDGTLQAPREAMAQAALLSGIALANSGLGMAHGVAAAMGVLHQIPHGLACAVMLPIALRANYPSCAHRLVELERALNPDGGREEAGNAFLRRIDALCQQLNIPSRLRELGITASALPALVAASRGNSMDGNPRQLTDEQLQELLEREL